MVVLEACLNGDRMRGDHPDLPISADELARDAKAVVAAGAEALHVHPRDASGRQTLGPHQCAATVAAIRTAVPGIPLGFTTIAKIERDPPRRVALVRKWTEKPDFVSVNWSEEGAAALATACVERDIGIEAGIWTVDDARRFVQHGFAPHCLRALVEPLEQQTAGALETAAAIVAILAAELPLVVHGYERTTWPVLRWAVAHGHGIRIGLEDTLALEGGRVARDNTELVAAAREIVNRSGGS